MGGPLLFFSLGRGPAKHASPGPAVETLLDSLPVVAGQDPDVDPEHRPLPRTRADTAATGAPDSAGRPEAPGAGIPIRAGGPHQPPHAENAGGPGRPGAESGAGLPFPVAGFGAAPAGHAAFVEPGSEQDSGGDPKAALQRRLSQHAHPWNHRKRQDGGLSQRHFPGASERRKRLDAGARNRVDPPDLEPVPGLVRFGGGHSPQRPLRAGRGSTSGCVFGRRRPGS